MREYIHTCVNLEGNTVDLLLTETEFKRASSRAIKNPEHVPICGQCWKADAPKTKCTLLNWLMGECCECGEC